jgi:uncharacterized protein
MTPTEKLEALYRTLPVIACQRKCQAYCGPILLSKIEAARLESKRGYLRLTSSFEAASRLYLPLPAVVERELVGLLPDRNFDCVFLEPQFAKCLAYSIRPLVCRLWGMVDTPLMRCPHGCVPSRWVTHEEARKLNEEIIAIQKEAGF